jgi:two-component system sensor histidine kinase QseC
MKPHAAPSLRTRLLAGVLGTIGLLGLAALLASYRQARHELDELLDAHLAQAAALLVARSDDELHELAGGHLPAADPGKPRLVLQLWVGRRLLLHSADAPEERLAAASEGFSTSTVAGVRWRVYSSVQADGSVLQLAEPVAHREHLARAVLWRLGWPLWLALPFIGVGVWFAIGRGLRPLQRLASAVAARAPLDDTPLPANGAPREILPLVQRLDALFARTAASVARERRFTGDASHELRTPIAAIRTQAQVAHGARDPAEREAALGRVMEGCDRAARVIEQLLALSRLDADAWPAGTCAIAPVARAVANELDTVAASHRVRVLLDVPDTLQAPLDADLLRIALRNVVENAIRYGRTGGRVRITARHADGVVRIDVDDDGPGIAPSSREAVLQRFNRLAGQARSGAGLGLAIVERIAHASGARLELGESDDGGLRVSLHWPAAGAHRG